ncbi:unnamed protein product [Cladocopium goreaui]|uniref:Metallo-beta-lactamase domain-containing protein n=1 Tax=Cladocopium goreaui TaxID=2562237 RepID=A0A9P1DG75_9DINO|nr:unnamed protein product [Cladocopium goreaui]
MSITPFLSEIASHIAWRMSGLFCSEVFFGQSWAFRGKRRETAQSIRPEEVLDSFDAIVNLGSSPWVGQSFQRLSKMAEMMPIISNPSAAKAIEQLGFSPSVLQPGELLGKVGTVFQLRSLMLGKLRISALPGSVVGPPWQDPENGYVFTDTRPGGLSIGTEPHGNLLGPALGTSFKRLPSSSTVPPLDAVILPLTSQQISGYRLVNGVQEAADTLEALDPVPRFLLPLRNAELDASGFLAEQLQEDGSVESFATLQRSRPKLRHVQLLDLQPGQLVQLELSPAQHSPA